VPDPHRKRERERERERENTEPIRKHIKMVGDSGSVDSRSKDADNLFFFFFFLPQL